MIVSESSCPWRTIPLTNKFKDTIFQVLVFERSSAVLLQFHSPRTPRSTFSRICNSLSPARGSWFWIGIFEAAWPFDMSQPLPERVHQLISTHHPMQFLSIWKSFRLPLSIKLSLHSSAVRKVCQSWDPESSARLQHRACRCGHWTSGCS